MKVTPHVSTVFEVGAILYDSWGWEQTNIDFYCITNRKAGSAYCVVFPMKKSVSEEIGFMTNEVMPTEINWNAKPQLKKIKSFDGKESGFSFRNYSGGGWCKLWKGSKITETHYA